MFITQLMDNAFAYQLVIVRNVSNTEKTFLVGIGTKDGINDRMEATFSNDNISLVARAIVVNRDESVWRIKEPGGKIPFQPNQTITFNFATERVWLVDPNEYLEEVTYRHEMAMAEKGRALRAEMPTNIAFKSYGIYGMNETISVKTSNEISGRSGYGTEIVYNQYSKNGFQLGIGGRFEKEKTESYKITVSSTRYLLIGSLSYFFRPFSNFEKTFFYTGTNIGIGQAKTAVGPMTMSGRAILFPSVYFGSEYSFKTFALLGEIHFESIKTEETFETGDKQDSSFTNAKASLGFAYFMD